MQQLQSQEDRRASPPRTHGKATSGSNANDSSKAGGPNANASGGCVFVRATLRVIVRVLVLVIAPSTLAYILVSTFYNFVMVGWVC